MKNLQTVIILSLLFFSCSKKIRLEKVNYDTAKYEVQTYKKAHPKPIPTNNDGLLNFHEIVCVGFYDEESATYLKVNLNQKGNIPQKTNSGVLKENLKSHLPKLNFKNALKIFEKYENLVGIRIHEAIDTKIKSTYKGLNYLTFIQNDYKSIDYGSDLQNEVYRITNIKIDLRDFREKINDQSIKTFHLSCQPKCPKNSLSED